MIIKTMKMRIKINEKRKKEENEIKIVTCISSLNLMVILKEGFEKIENIKNEEEKLFFS